MESFNLPHRNFYFHRCCECFINNGKYITYEPVRDGIHRELKDCNNEEHKKLLNNLLEECKSCDYSSPKFAISLKKILIQS